MYIDDVKIVKASNKYSNEESISHMREKLHTNEGTISIAENFSEKLDELKEALKDARGYIALNSQDQPIAYITWEIHDETQKYVPNSIFLSELYVEPDYRRQGIARKLVEAVLADERLQDEKLWLTHDPEEDMLTEFYGKFGFKVTGKTNAGNVIMIMEEE